MSSTYPIAAGVCLTRPATPSLPLAPTPVGQLSEVAIPTVFFQLAETFPS